jgi:hypothetical protein
MAFNGLFNGQMDGNGLPKKKRRMGQKRIGILVPKVRKEELPLYDNSMEAAYGSSDNDKP